MQPILKPFVLVIFGASGDLTRRKLVPALYDLYQAKLLPPSFTVLGYARRDWDKSEFIKAVSAHLAESDQRTAFLEHFEYQQGDFTLASDYRQLDERLKRLDTQAGLCSQRLFYIATPPDNYHRILEGIAAAGLQEPCDEAGWTRIVVEKPFGHDLSSAQRLDNQLRTIFQEDQIYRIDHYLAKETAQNIAAFRFANSIFEPIWSNRYIERIDITMKETIGIGTRGAFYDKTGVLRDVIQNHLLQLLALMTMDEPDGSPESYRDERAKALTNLRMSEDRTHILLGQYEGYANEANVALQSHTATYAEVKLHLSGPRWGGVDVVLRAGKALDETKTVVEVVFKASESNLYKNTNSSKYYNNVIFNIQPKEGIQVGLLAKSPGYRHALQPVNMHFDYVESFNESSIDAYSRLLLDAVEGDVTLFARSDEIEAQWRLIDPIVQQATAIKPIRYEQGSEGPTP